MVRRTQERNHQPHMTLVADWLSLISPCPGEEDHVWCVIIMYFSQTHFGPGNSNTTVIKPSRLPNAKTTTYFHKNVKIGIFNFTYFLSVKPLSWWQSMLTPTAPPLMQMSFQKIRFPQRGIIMTKQFLCSTNGTENCAS